jgi:hypothetical protein
MNVLREFWQILSRRCLDRGGKKQLGAGERYSCFTRLAIRKGGAAVNRTLVEEEVLQKDRERVQALLHNPRLCLYDRKYRKTVVLSRS